MDSSGADDKNYIYLGLSILALIATTLFKSYILLGAGAYWGILYIRRINEKRKYLLVIPVIVLSLIAFFIVREWIVGYDYKGPHYGSTTSIHEFGRWLKHTFMPIYLNVFIHKNVAFFISYQIGPIIAAIGTFSFFTACIALIFNLIKKRYDVLVFVLLWSVPPTIFWLFAYFNTANHNMLAILPFLIIGVLFLYEKISQHLLIFFAGIIIIGNLIISPSFPMKNFKTINFFKSQIRENERSKDLHLVAQKIANLEDNKIIITKDAFRPYLLYEIFSLMPSYKFIKLDNYCYKIENKRNMVCFITYISIEDILAILKKNIAEDRLKDYTIIATRAGLEKLDSDISDKAALN